MSLDDLPPLAATIDPGGRAYQERVIAAARKVLASTHCETDIPYRADDYWQKLDIFRPNQDGDTPLSVFCFIHGGGWYTGHKEWVTFMAPSILATPAVFVTPSYRHAPAAQFPAQLDDCADAIAWVYRNIARYGGDPGRIHLGGHSAGAHLAALTALRRDVLAARALPPDVIKACYPVSGRYDLRQAAPARNGQTVVEALLGKANDAVGASPTAQVAGNQTPFFVAAGSEDLPGFPAQARDLVAALSRERCTVRYREFEGYNHFMMNEQCSLADHPWMCEVREWLQQPPAYGIA